MVVVCKNLEILKNFDFQKYCIGKIGVIKVEIVDSEKFVDNDGYVGLNSRDNSATNDLEVVSSNSIGYTPVTEECGVGFIRAKKLDEFGQPDFDDPETIRLPFVIAYPEMEQQLKVMGLRKVKEKSK
jgi:hypothetical protein